MQKNTELSQCEVAKFIQSHLNYAAIWLCFLLLVAIKFDMFSKALNGLSFIILLFVVWLLLSYIVMKIYGGH